MSVFGVGSLINVVNLNGAILYTSVQEFNEGNNLIELDVNSWADGMYFIQVTGNSFQTSTEFEVIHY